MHAQKFCSPCIRAKAAYDRVDMINSRMCIWMQRHGILNALRFLPPRAFFFCGDYEWGARLHAGKIVCCFGFTLWIFWLCKRGKKNLEAKKNVSVNVATELNSSHIQINVYLNSPFIMCFLCAKCILSLALYYNEHSRGEKFMLPNATLHRRDGERERDEHRTGDMNA